MTYDTNTAGEAAGSARAGQYGRSWQEGDYFGWARSPGFHPLKLLAVLTGFAIFPPLGVAALAYFIWNGRRHAGRGGHHRMMGEGRCGVRGGRGRTGNSAFDDYRAQVLNDLEAERQSFAAHREAERRSRDQAAFDAFKAKRGTQDEKPADGQG
jgi:Protein of unknown function (DUF2852)